MQMLICTVTLCVQGGRIWPQKYHLAIHSVLLLLFLSGNQEYPGSIVRSSQCHRTAVYIGWPVERNYHNVRESEKLQKFILRDRNQQEPQSGFPETNFLKLSSAL